jgi:hypothetical protein
MKPRTIKLTPTTSEEPLVFDAEKPFIKFTSFQHNIAEEDLRRYSVDLKMTLRNGDSSRSVPTGHIPMKPGRATGLDISFVIEPGEIPHISVNATKDHESMPKDAGIEFTLEYEILDRLDTSMPSAGFDEHIGDSRNTKILFSAPFGQGKSTFLQRFFEERTEKYRLFKLLPVNYSVGSNEDIFKFIKCELFMQLIAMEADFEVLDVPYSETTKLFLAKNGDRLLASLLSLLPDIGKDVYQAFDKFKKLSDKFHKLHEELQKNDEVTAESFLEAQFENEGTFYEENYFTQIICQTLDRFKAENSDRQNVLLIDDLDRMDPAHIFRILNVFSAQFDVGDKTQLEMNNKFGFDKVILVCDFDNIKHIYEYRYGPKVHFEGYINKFYSTKPFPYNNEVVIASLLKNIDGLDEDYIPYEREPNFIFEKIARAMVTAEQLTLREILKLQQIGLYTKKVELSKCKERKLKWFKQNAFSQVIMLLSDLGGTESLISNISELKSENFYETIPTHEWCFSLIAGFTTSESTSVTYHHELSETVETISFNLEHGGQIPYLRPSGTSIHRRQKKDIIPTTDRRKKASFEFDDFIKLLVKNIEFYAAYRKTM